MSRNVKNKIGTNTGYADHGKITVFGNRNNRQYRTSGIIPSNTVASIKDDEDLQVVATGTGNSSALNLPNDGEYVLTFESAGAFALDVQVDKASDGTFTDLYFDSSNQATIDTTASAPRDIVVQGGMQYRMSVDTYNNDITMSAYRLNKNN